jgi:hypothetical protein
MVDIAPGEEEDVEDEDAVDEDDKDDDDEDEAVEYGGVGKWLHQVLQNEQRPTFLLPSVYAGPDVMFVLRNHSVAPVQRYICAVQVCSKPNHSNL